MDISHFCSNLFLHIYRQIYAYTLIYSYIYTHTWASQVELVVKNPPANAGNVRDTGSIPGWGRSPGGEHGNLLQYSCLENPMDREAWQATVQGLTKSETTEATWHTQAHICTYILFYKLGYYVCWAWTGSR